MYSHPRRHHNSPWVGLAEALSKEQGHVLGQAVGSAKRKEGNNARAESSFHRPMESVDFFKP
jgi:hypothetical protein